MYLLFEVYIPSNLALPEGIDNVETFEDPVNARAYLQALELMGVPIDMVYVDRFDTPWEHDDGEPSFSTEGNIFLDLNDKEAMSWY